MTLTELSQVGTMIIAVATWVSSCVNGWRLTRMRKLHKAQYDEYMLQRADSVVQHDDDKTRGGS